MMGGTIAMTSKKQEQGWETEEDARTIQRMGEIIGDPARHGRAKKKLDEMIVNMEKSKKVMELMKSSKLEYTKSPKDEKK